jgi:molybdate transport system permease protein
MDWTAFRLSLALAGWTVAILLPVGIIVGRQLAYRRFPGRGLIEGLLALPLVLPPTVLGFYLLVTFGDLSPFGEVYRRVFGQGLVFTFEGLVAASLIANLPFAIQPVQRAFEAVPRELRDAAACCGMSPLATLLRIELPLAWPGMLGSVVLTFAHTLGEFGVVLMVGGNIPGETKTIAVAIYDRVQAFDEAAAGRMSLALLCISLAAIAAANMISAQVGRRHG